MTRWGDDRAQAIQIGAIVLFAFLVLAFSGYQTVVVPDQNEQVEFRHSLTVAEDMQELRNGLLEAGSSGRLRTAEIALGTAYPSRLFGLNPSPPGGRLWTESVGTGEITLDAPGADIEDVCGYDRDGDGSVPSRSMVYAPSYNVYQHAPTIAYENSVVYRSFGERVLFDSDQQIIDGTRITVSPLRGDYSESGSGAATVDFRAGLTGVGETTRAQNTTLTLPTRLNASQWEVLLEDELIENGGHVVDVSNNASSSAVDVELEDAFYTVRCPVVGVGTAPDNTPDRVLGQGGDDINPVGGGAIRLANVTRSSEPTDDNISLTFRNPGEQTNLSAARFNFYYRETDPGPKQLDVRESTTARPAVEALEVRGRAKEPNTVVEFAGDDATTELYFGFEDGSGSSVSPEEADFAVVNLRFTDGRSGNYFVNFPANNPGSNGSQQPSIRENPSPR